MSPVLQMSHHLIETSGVRVRGVCFGRLPPRWVLCTVPSHPLLLPLPPPPPLAFETERLWK